MAEENEQNLNREHRPDSGQATGNIWRSLPLPVRIGVLLIAGLVIGLTVFFSLGGPAPQEMATLFHRLDPVQAREIAAALDEQGVRYELADDGTTIQVPPEQRDRLRLSLSPDLYAQGIGFDLFENGGLVASDFERRVQWQVALEEELRRTITSIEAVDQARVHLVIAEEGLFIRERSEPSASVFLRLSPLAALTESQVRGILSLVAGSVENLKPENVTIVDSRGNILYDAFAALEDMSVPAGVESQLTLKRQFETELERRLGSILEQVYGPGRAVAMVSADMDFDTREETLVAYADNPVARSTHRIEERSENIGAPAEEVGEPNIPGQAAVVGFSGDSTYEHLEEIVNYEVGETRQYVNAAPGKVVRLSTAVIIDNDGNDPFMAEQVTDLVNSAIGLDQQRGDTVSVQLLPFDERVFPEPFPEPPVIADEAPFPFHWVLIAAAVLLLLLLLLFLLFRSRSRRREEEELLDAMSLEEELAARMATAAEAQTDPGEAEIKARSLRDMAKEEPESVAGLLKTWLVEE